MSLLLSEAMKRLDEIGADASRLSGFRQRYARYGYEPIGKIYTFTLTEHNIRAARTAWRDGVSFAEIGPKDEALLARAAELHQSGLMAVERGGAEEFYRVLTAWESRPAAAFRDGRMIGYLVADGAGDHVISEWNAEDDGAAVDLLCAWMREKGLSSLRISVEAWRIGLIRRLVSLCEGFSVASPCRFFIRSWDRATDALLAMKRRITYLPDGEAVVGIEGWGKMEICVRGNETCARRTQREPQIWLTHADAAQLIMGVLPAECAANLPEEYAQLFSAWFPLPLSWCTLDRV